MSRSPLLDDHVITQFETDPIASAGPSWLRHSAANHWLSTSTLTSLNRRRRLYAQIVLVIVIGAWINHAWPRAHQVPAAASMTNYDKLEYLIGRPLCPDATKPQGPVNQIIADRPRNCFVAHSADASFRIEICPVPTTCNSFSVIVQRTDTAECDRLQSLKVPATDPGTEQWLREEKGPDSFLLRTNGAQRWVSEMSLYEGECRYRFDVTLANGGPIWLELFWLYTEYAYFNEPSKQWPENHFQSVLVEPLLLEICPIRCRMRYAPRLGEVEDTHPENGVGSDSRLPECSKDERYEGVWLPRHPMDVVDPPVPVVPPRVGFQPLMGVYEYYVPGCRWTHRGKQFGFDYGACASTPKNVLFAGDSHGRYVLHAFKHRLDNNTEYYTGHTTDHGPFHYTYGLLTLDFWWNAKDEYLKFDYEKLGTYDSILYSYGAWELMAGTTVKEFARKLEDFVRLVKNAQEANDPNQQRTRENVFLVPPPVPPRLTGPAREHADQRTNHRFAAYRDAAVQILVQYGWRVVDQFAIAAPVVLEINAVDGGHLSPGAAHGAIVDEVVAKMDLCYT